MVPKTAIVIGGGIAGCSTVYALAQRGIQVTLLERNDTIASEASGNPLAMLYPRLSGDDTSSQFALAGYLHSLALFKSLNLSPADFDTCGMLQLGFNQNELARIQKVATQNHPNSILKYVTQFEASTLAGIDIVHDALYFPNAAWVKPQQLCKRLTEHKSISILTSNNVDRLLKNGHAFEVYDHKNIIAKADIVIIANANDAQQLCQNLPLNTQAVRGQVSILKYAETSRQLKTIVCSDGYLSPVALKQNARHCHCLGATFSGTATLSTQHNDLQIDGKDHLTNLDKLNNISPFLHDQLQDKIVDGRVSLRCTTTDYWPLVGQLLDPVTLKAKPPRPSAATNSLPWVSGLYMNVAHGSKGFTSAPLCAELLASSICNEKLPISNEMAGLLNPNRFLLREMGLKRLAKMTVTLS
ncbi:MAG: FAD-dependent 5-carboxymethylaminomethyl-2-thiouridine(34) oxidoreductase MnmC [Methylotenera sp.]|nr:FAD-dependent 5-carboxymethylaminomethyl-2-thiouridine(34) oxidoreductase MnmC [Methylotenera sp.]MDP2402795.1 FAD-dependent 5-carboxymethylaminomethyl-2-thiouridine(34) oxidoreductase MnmC [Methylotenera sp.]MDP3094637.1 FAD-dependent 5-carboxymethylaminomethyl-2-thiouridine(34) oxidoreductase MnmC [Methylotenera sp.]MDZ4223782.1 FAD-dependent 5-carboxymethylaminomethyl-2-thiouridine(34) oxidoreductase MnmC [Methylotenera sp.]